MEISLPSLLESVPTIYHRQLAALEALSSTELRTHLRSQLDAKSVERYDPLLKRNAAGTLDALANSELDELRRTADLLMYRKVYAALILKSCGEYVSVAAL